MKISIEIDCTPLEARRFLGLPDVEPLQNAMMKEMQDKMTSTMALMDPELLARTWFPIGSQGLEHMQRLMFGAARSALDGSAERKEKPSRPARAEPAPPRESPEKS